jgi:hypothetical protein
MRLLFVTRLGHPARGAYAIKWRSGMKILLVSKLSHTARAVNTTAKYVEAGRALGHDVAVFGEHQSEPPALPASLDVKAFDFAVFVVYMPWDFPDLPYLARLLDSMPKERRVLIDCTGRYNDTVRVEHDFNHLEKMEGHQGWEWVEGFRAVSDRILQPTLRPLRDDVRPFLFHGFDPRAVARPYESAREAARAWAGDNVPAREFGVTYVGTNWQRWSQVRRFLEAVEPLRADLGRICLAGWDWDKRPDWAVQMGIQGVDTDPELLRRLGVETRPAIPYDQVIPFLGQARFSPVFHRPLFNQLGLVTNRTFETFGADTMPLLMLPDRYLEDIYGPAARPLAPGDDVAGRLRDMARRPEVYWDAVLRVRAHLAREHSFARRFKELLAILEG